MESGHEPVERDPRKVFPRIVLLVDAVNAGPLLSRHGHLPLGTVRGGCDGTAIGIEVSRAETPVAADGGQPAGGVLERWTQVARVRVADLERTRPGEVEGPLARRGVVETGRGGTSVRHIVVTVV